MAAMVAGGEIDGATKSWPRRYARRFRRHGGPIGAGLGRGSMATASPSWAASVDGRAAPTAAAVARERGRRGTRVWAWGEKVGAEKKGWVAIL